MIAAVGLMTFAACGTKNENKAEGEQPEGVEQAEAQEVKEGSMGPCTVSCNKFSIDIPEGWEVRVIKEKEISVGKEYSEGLEFVYDDAANYTQSRSIKMEISGMQDLGEQTYGDNTYATYIKDDSYSAIMKVGDGENAIIKVNTTNVKTADNETVLKVLGSLKLK